MGISISTHALFEFVECLLPYEKNVERSEHWKDLKKKIAGQFAANQDLASTNVWISLIRLPANFWDHINWIQANLKLPSNTVNFVRIT